MRRVAITGHTRGLGAALFERFSVSDMVVGLSRSNGFDIRKIDKIIERIDECDVFINNAYDRYSQVDLLYAVYDMWKDKEKKIINIGSLASMGIRDYLQPYAIHKKALHEAHTQIAYQQNKCKSYIFNIGYITDSQTDVAELIYNTVNNKMYIGEVKVMPDG
jgi:short-subunit dehydrogenase